jgi:hypothetical protein
MAPYDTLRDFKRDTCNHRIEVVKDEGLHRHLRFSKPGTNCYHFNIVTWPGYLAITGDMGAAVFTRLPDMFEFFRESAEHHEAAGGLFINIGYWAEKCAANDGEKKQFSRDRLEGVVREIFDEYMATRGGEEEDFEARKAALWSHIEDYVLGAEDVRSAIEAMSNFEPAGYMGYEDNFADFRFADAWEYSSSIEEYTYHFIWRLYAISHAVMAYDALKSGEGAKP